MQVLIVDDNHFELNGMKDILNKSFPTAEVSTASNGSSGIKLAQEKSFDLIITDIKMPDISGVDLIREVRKTNRKVKLLVISGYDSFETAKSLLSLNVTDYLLKPLNINEFISVLDKLLQPLQTTEANFSEYTVKAITLIKNSYSTPITLDFLAQEIHLAPSYLSRIFTKEVGIGINQYITNLRMEKAKRLLMTSTLKINQIAKDCGFESPSYFNRVFLNQEGISPTEFRKKHL